MTGTASSRRISRLLALGLVLVVTAVSCGDDDGTIGVSPIFNGCEAGAGSVIAFLQRTLDEIGTAEAGELQESAERFDRGVNGLLLRAQEVHCTEEGFNQATIARVGELQASGPGGEMLKEEVGRIGLGSLEESRGGPITLPGG